MTRLDRKLRVLIIDDEPSARFGIRDFFELQGFEVVEAVDCRSGMESFLTWSPDAVILDYLLPDGDALELMRRMKAIGPRFPVLILTAHESIELAVRAMKGGADHFLTKPLKLPALLTVLETEIARYHSTENPGSRS